MRNRLKKNIKKKLSKKEAPAPKTTVKEVPAKNKKQAPVIQTIVKEATPKKTRVRKKLGDNGSGKTSETKKVVSHKKYEEGGWVNSPENDLTILEKAPRPHDPFCYRCQHSDNRGYKDAITTLMSTINMVAPELDVVENDWELKCKKLMSWARKQAQRKQTAQKKITKRTLERIEDEAR